VDCTTGGKVLCERIGVKGYPTIKYGDPNSLEDYEGGRDFEALKKFAQEKLGPNCGPANLDLCDDEKKAFIQKFQAMSSPELEAAISEKDRALATLEADLKTFVEGLQKQYTEVANKKDKDVEVIEKRGLDIMKLVAAHSKAGKAEL